MEIDLSNVPMPVRQKMDEIFRHDFELQALKAIQRQTRRAALNHLNRPRARDDFGPKTLEVDTFVDAIWRRAYGNNYMADTGLLHFLAKRNPEITVRSLGTRIQSGWSPGENSRWRKRYLAADEKGAK